MDFSRQKSRLKLESRLTPKAGTITLANSISILEFIKQKDAVSEDSKLYTMSNQARYSSGKRRWQASNYGWVPQILKLLHYNNRGNVR